MDCVNLYGLTIMAIIMIPNVIFAIKVNNFENKYNNKLVEVIEQIGRVGSMILMIVNVQFWEYGYWFINGKIVYMVVTGVLACIYCIIWASFFRKTTFMKSIWLAIIPTLIFLVSGIVELKVLLIITAIFFGASHIIITYNNN